MPAAERASSSSQRPHSSAKPYDPRQDAVEKREVRKGYRGLIAEVEDAGGNLGEIKAADLTEMVKRADEFRSKVKAPNEGVLDSRFLIRVSDVGAQMARSMKLNSNAFDIDEYITRVARFIGGAARRSGGHANDDEDEDVMDLDDDDLDSWNWQRLGTIAAGLTKRAPTMDHLVGALSVQTKERASNRRTNRLERDEEEVRPETLNEGDIQKSENETTKLVQHIAKLLADVGGGNGCNLFEFAINPESFSNTVENLFYISFLVRDGKVSIDYEDDGEPIILRSEAPTEEDYAAGLKKRQVVMELDQATWKNLIKAYDIKHSVIPTRKSATTARTGKWY
ncbi:hypothetical protein BCV69DRAFT_246606 [Microstroma glucosiphilum]|uniref:Non-structural maintenance of chromosomes element 4 n=1 Tax=Pseudomicrostroma glucosiphilum TaxID=1684307 RepID=A0A316UBC7_9BASI|nr:hypothetical protein BCV69DRAFT_246606 [Pseudomicrostroma glucosiphilum]PWN22469.1 hypothetical protein BCV69DRAFT_246606 [Pseudomicrostroma glucosiphilum]